MNLDIVTLTTYLSLGLIIYYFLIELSKPKEGAQKWVLWLFLAVIIGIILYLMWSAYHRQKKGITGKKSSLFEQIMGKDNEIEDSLDEEDYEDSDFNETNYEEESRIDVSEDFVQSKYILQKKDFALVDGQSVDNAQIKYEDFKLWYLTPEFLQKYTEAIKQALKIKKRRLFEVRKKYMADLKALRGANHRGEGLSKLLSSIEKNDDAKMIETTIGEIELLLKEIKKREKIIDIDSTRQGLISALTDKDHGIDSLTGRDDIKDFLALQLYTFAQNPRIFFSNFQNMAIYGSSGVGKTCAAQVIGHVYASCGILVRNHVHIVTKQSMTTAYVNESAKMTRKLLLANLESIIFVDEAYDLSPPPTILGNGVDHGHEAITEMVNFIDKMKGLSVIIVAGYKDEMETRFMKANEGLPRRFPHIFTLKPYSAKELTDILIKFILTNCPDIRFKETHGNYIFTIINYLNKEHKDIFSKQAGDMDNLSGYISRAAYGSPGKSWNNNAEELILSGFNAYLNAKNLTIELLE